MPVFLACLGGSKPAQKAYPAYAQVRYGPGRAQKKSPAQLAGLAYVCKLKLVDLDENLRAELAKKLDNCGKLTSELDAERTKSADLEDQLKLLRDKGL